MFFQPLLLPHGNVCQYLFISSFLVDFVPPPGYLATKYILGPIVPKVLNKVTFEIASLILVKGAEGYLPTWCLLFATAQTQDAARDTQRE